MSSTQITTVTWNLPWGNNQRALCKAGSRQYAVFYNGSNLVYTYSDDDGATWAATTTVKTGAYMGNAVYDSVSGRVEFIYGGAGSANLGLYKRAITSNVTSGTPGSLNTETAIDSGGTNLGVEFPHAWISQTGTHPRLWVVGRKYTASGGVSDIRVWYAPIGTSADSAGNWTAITGNLAGAQRKYGMGAWWTVSGVDKCTILAQDKNNSTWLAWTFDPTATTPALGTSTGSIGGTYLDDDYSTISPMAFLQGKGEGGGDFLLFGRLDENDNNWDFFSTANGTSWTSRNANVTAGRLQMTYDGTNIRMIYCNTFESSATNDDPLSMRIYTIASNTLGSATTFSDGNGEQVGLPVNTGSSKTAAIYRRGTSSAYSLRSDFQASSVPVSQTVGFSWEARGSVTHTVACPYEGRVGIHQSVSPPIEARAAIAQTIVASLEARVVLSKTVLAPIEAGLRIIQTTAPPLEAGVSGLHQSAVAPLEAGMLGLVRSFSAPVEALQTYRVLSVFGTTTPGGSWANAPADFKYGNKYTLALGGMVSKVTAYMEGNSGVASQSFRALIYADSGGAPGALLATSNDVTIAANAVTPAFYDFALPSPVHLPAGSYWIVQQAGATTSVVNLAYTTGAAGANQYNTDTFSDGPTDPFGSPSGDTSLYTMYATYVPDPAMVAAPLEARGAIAKTAAVPFEARLPLSQTAVAPLEARFGLVKQLTSPATITLGKTTLGASALSTAGNIRMGNIFTLTQAATLSKVTAYLQANGAQTQAFRAVVYNASGGTVGTLVAVGSSFTISSDGSTDGWNDSTFTPVALPAGDYLIGLWEGTLIFGGAQWRYDAGSSGSSHSTPETYSGVASPASPWGTDTTGVYLFSVYASLSIAAGISWESRGTVTQTQAVPLEARGAVAKTAAAWFEARGSVSQSAVAPLEARTPLSKTALVPLEAGVRGLAQTVAAPFEAGLRITQAALVSLEARGVVAQTALVPYEARVLGIAKTAAVSWEATQPANIYRTVGVLTPGASGASPPADYKFGNKFTIPGGWVTSLQAWFTGNGGGSSQVFRMMLYADSGGAPGALLGTTASVTFPANAITPSGSIFYLPTPVYVPPGDYWLVMQSGPTDFLVQVMYDATATSYYNADAYSDGPTDPFGSPSTDAHLYSFSANYVEDDASVRVSWEARGAVTKTDQIPYEADASITVSQNVVVPYEARGSVAKTLAAAYEGLVSGISKTVVPPLEARGSVAKTVAAWLEARGAVTQTAVAPVEARTPLAQSAVAPYEGLVRGIAQTEVSPFEARGSGIAQTSVFPAEARGALTKAQAVPLEANGSIFRTAAAWWEGLVTGLHQSAAAPFEAGVSGVTKTVVPPVEANVGSKQTVVAPLEARGAITKTVAAWWEARGYLAQSAAAPYEGGVAGLAKQIQVSFEGLVFGIAKTVAAPVEARGSGISQTIAAAWEARGAITATRSISLESRGSVAQQLAASYEGLVSGLAKALVFPAEAQVGISKATTAALEALAGIRQSTGFPVESDSSATTVSQVLVVVWEALGAITRSAIAPVEAGVSGLHQSALAPVEAAIGSSKAAQAPLEAGVGIARSAVAPAEARVGIAQQQAAPLEARGALTQAVTAPLEARGSIARTCAAPFEGLVSGLARALAFPFEGMIARVQLALSLPVEAGVGSKQVVLAPVEARGSVAQSALSPLEARGSITKTSAAWWEANVPLSKQATAPAEARGSLVQASVSPFESLAGIKSRALYSEAVMLDGPVGYWRLDETSGNTAVDRTGTQDGTYTNSSSVAGLLSGDTDKAAAFTGTLSGIGMPNVSAHALTTGSIEAWIKTTTADAMFRTIIAKQYAYGIFLQNGVLVAYDWVATAAVSSGVNLADGQIHHVVFVFQSGVTNGSYFVIDGKQVGAFTYHVQNQTTALGIASNAAGQSFLGTIDEAAIYPTALSPARALAHYNAGINLGGFPVEARTPVAVTAVSTWEALASAASALSLPVDVLGALAKQAVAPYEHNAPVSAQRSLAWEAGVRPSRTWQATWEANGGLAATWPIVWEAGGLGAVVSSSIGFPYEAIVPLAMARALPFESRILVSAACSLPAEAQLGVAATVQAALDAIGSVCTSAALPFEARLQLARAVVAIVEASAGIRQQLLLPVEARGAIAVQATLPLEAMVRSNAFVSARWEADLGLAKQHTAVFEALTGVLGIVQIPFEGQGRIIVVNSVVLPYESDHRTILAVQKILPIEWGIGSQRAVAAPVEALIDLFARVLVQMDDAQTDPAGSLTALLRSLATSAELSGIEGTAVLEPLTSSAILLPRSSALLDS